jgi:hypothetical protein
MGLTNNKVFNRKLYKSEGIKCTDKKLLELINSIKGYFKDDLIKLLNVFGLKELINKREKMEICKKIIFRNYMNIRLRREIKMRIENKIIQKKYDISRKLSNDKDSKIGDKGKEKNIEIISVIDDCSKSLIRELKILNTEDMNNDDVINLIYMFKKYIAIGNMINIRKKDILKKFKEIHNLKKLRLNKIKKELSVIRFGENIENKFNWSCFVNDFKKIFKKNIPIEEYIIEIGFMMRYKNIIDKQNKKLNDLEFMKKNININTEYIISNLDGHYNNIEDFIYLIKKKSMYRKYVSRMLREKNKIEDDLEMNIVRDIDIFGISMDYPLTEPSLTYKKKIRIKKWKKNKLKKAFFGNLFRSNGDEFRDGYDSEEIYVMSESSYDGSSDEE